MKLWQRIKSLFVKRHQGAANGNVRNMFPLVLGVLAVLGASVVGSSSSYIKLVPSTTAVIQGERFTIDVYAVASVPVNALDVTIAYAPEAISIISVDKGQSVLTIWTKEPEINPNTIVLSGGTFRRGFIGEHLVASIKVEAKHTGSTEFFIKNAELLAGDGLGTKVAVSGTGETNKTSFVIYDQNSSPESIVASVELKINADIDGDGEVTLKDVSSFMAAWNNKSNNYDFNKDGRMNFVDFSIILAKSFF
jgi:hypothetical protein